MSEPPVQTIREGCTAAARYWLADARRCREVGNRAGALRVRVLARYAIDRLRPAIRWRYDDQPYSPTMRTIWVCRCCLLSHANGECCADRKHGGDSREPLSLIGPCESVAMGLAEDEHDDECTDADRAEGCDCGRREYDTSSCDGCGSYLHGSREVLTVWDDSAWPVWQRPQLSRPDPWLVVGPDQLPGQLPLPL